MNPDRRRLLLVLGAPVTATAWADDLSAEDRLAVRATVEAQLRALAAGDAVQAFSYASASIRRQFGDAQTFIGMVRQGYPMVIRPAATAFFQAQWVDGAALQVVQLRDAAGQRWLATYQLIKPANAADQPWRINGVVVVADTGKSST